MEILNPDFEVIVRVNGSDVAVAAGFIVAGDNIDLLVGMERPSDSGRIIHLLEYVVAGINGASWLSMDELGISDSDDEEVDGAIPF